MLAILRRFKVSPNSIRLVLSSVRAAKIAGIPTLASWFHHPLAPPILPLPPLVFQPFTILAAALRSRPTLLPENPRIYAQPAILLALIPRVRQHPSRLASCFSSPGGASDSLSAALCPTCCATIRLPPPPPPARWHCSKLCFDFMAALGIAEIARGRLRSPNSRTSGLLAAFSPKPTYRWRPFCLSFSFCSASSDAFAARIVSSRCSRRRSSSGLAPAGPCSSSLVCCAFSSSC